MNSPISLNRFIGLSIDGLRAFEKHYAEGYKDDPSTFPMYKTEADWFEEIQTWLEQRKAP